MDTVNLGPLTHEPLDEGAHCATCGRLGTVAVTVLHSQPEQVERFCEPCWPAARERFETKIENDTIEWMRASMRAGPFNRPAKPPGSSAGSRSWHDVNLFIDRYVFGPDGISAVGADELAQMARKIREDAPRMYGAMPRKIAAFLEQYGPPAT